ITALTSSRHSGPHSRISASTSSSLSWASKEFPNQSGSTTRTVSPRARSSRTSKLPIYPAPPVTRIIIMPLYTYWLVAESVAQNRDTYKHEHYITSKLALHKAYLSWGSYESSTRLTRVP